MPFFIHFKEGPQHVDWADFSMPRAPATPLDQRALLQILAPLCVDANKFAVPEDLDLPVDLRCSTPVGSNWQGLGRETQLEHICEEKEVSGNKVRGIFALVTLLQQSRDQVVPDEHRCSAHKVACLDYGSTRASDSKVLTSINRKTEQQAHCLEVAQIVAERPTH